MASPDVQAMAIKRMVIEAAQSLQRDGFEEEVSQGSQSGGKSILDTILSKAHEPVQQSDPVGGAFGAFFGPDKDE
jgi:hypothetical protein